MSAREQSESFQADLYPPAPAAQPALSAAEFFAGKTAPPIFVALDSQQITSAPKSASSATTVATPTPVKPTSTSSAPVPQLTHQTPDSHLPSRSLTLPSPLSTSSVTNGTPSPLERERDHEISSPTHSPTLASAATTTANNNEEVEALRRELEALRAELRERDEKIRVLEVENERLLAAQKQAAKLLGVPPA